VVGRAVKRRQCGGAGLTANVRRAAKMGMPQFCHRQEEYMPKKKRNKNQLSLERQVNRVIRFFETHERAFPAALPINLHKDLDTIAERYFFDCYRCHRCANENYLLGNINQAKKDLTYSLVWQAEACDSAYYAGINDFSNMLLDKTDSMLDNAIETIFADECPSQKLDPLGFTDFRMPLQTSMD
jgi:hypothetical protein